VTAVGKGFVAVLATDMRGPIERRPATTRREAFAAARDLLVGRTAHIQGGVGAVRAVAVRG